MHGTKCVFYVCFSAIGVGLAVKAGETVQPNPRLCFERPAGGDFGMPDYCTNDTQEHRPNSLAYTYNSTTSSSANVVISYAIDFEPYDLEPPLPSIAPRST